MSLAEPYGRHRGGLKPYGSSKSRSLSRSGKLRRTSSRTESSISHTSKYSRTAGIARGTGERVIHNDGSQGRVSGDRRPRGDVDMRSPTRPRADMSSSKARSTKHKRIVSYSSSSSTHSRGRSMGSAIPEPSRSKSRPGHSRSRSGSTGRSRIPVHSSTLARHGSSGSGRTRSTGTTLNGTSGSHRESETRYGLVQQPAAGSAVNTVASLRQRRTSTTKLTALPTAPVPTAGASTGSPSILPAPDTRSSSGRLSARRLSLTKERKDIGSVSRRGVMASIDPLAKSASPSRPISSTKVTPLAGAGGSGAGSTSVTEPQSRTSVLVASSRTSSSSKAGGSSSPSRSRSSGSSGRGTGSGSNRAPRGVSGLYNLGNTCFMNSCLQCLSNTAPLTNYFLQNRHNESGALNPKSRTKGHLAKAYAQLIQRMWKPGNSGAERPQEVKKVVGQVASRFIGYEQQDSQEFLRFFLDALHEDLNQVRQKPKYVEIKDDDDADDKTLAKVWWDNYAARNRSPVMDMFCGQLRSVVTCSDCGHVSRAYDPFWDLSVPIPKKHQVKERRFGGALNFGRKSGGESSVQCTIEDCLRSYCEPEKLEGQDTVYCSRCKDHKPSVKQMSLFSIPPVLVIHIKRFSHSLYRRTKLTTCIKFPAEGLDMGKYCLEGAPQPKSTVYDLIAVSHHMGGLGGGHYVADGRNQDTGEWHSFNDSHTASTSASRINGSTAYMLFYQRRDAREWSKL